jgi:hypothetical protein
MKIDFAQLFRDYGIDFIQPVSGWVNVDCPICHHTGSRGYKGGFNTYGGYYNCWACGGTDSKYVLATLLSINYADIDALLIEYGGHVSAQDKIKCNHATHTELPCDYLDEHCKKYINKRNFDADYLEEKYKLVGMTYTGEFAGRIIIPIFYRGKLVSYQGRSLLGKNTDVLRYMTLSKEDSVVNPKHILYNLDNCKNDYAVVVEGAFDNWRFGDDCCATLGTSTSPEQRLLLVKKFSKVFLVFDPEKEAQERANKLGKRLSALGMKEVEVIDTELDHDPGDMTEKEIKVLKRGLGI